MGKKFLLISQVFYPDQVSTANLFTDLCGVLAREGVSVEVWAGHPSYTNYVRQPSNVEYKGININYLPSTNFKKTSILGRLFNIVTFSTSACLKILFSKDKTPVWTHTTPPFLGIILSKICVLRKRKFIYILLDIFPEGLVRLGKLSARNPFIRYWNYLFLNSLKRSTKVIVIGRDISTWVQSVCPAIEGKLLYIPHWQSDSLISPVLYSKNEFIIENDLCNKFVVQYSGNIGLWNEVKTMGKAVSQGVENVIFMFVGDGIRKNELLSEFSNSRQDNVILLPFQPNEIFNTILTASKVHLVTLRNGLEGMAVPCKIYGILAAGVPVLAMVPKESEIAYVVKEENCGFVIDPLDLDGLIHAITLMKSDEGLRTSMGKNSRLAFEKKYTTEIIAKKYSSLLQEL